MTVDYLRHRWGQIRANSKALVDAAVLLQHLPDPIRFEAVESMTIDALAQASRGGTMRHMGWLGIANGLVLFGARV